MNNIEVETNDIGEGGSRGKINERGKCKVGEKRGYECDADWDSDNVRYDELVSLDGSGIKVLYIIHI